MKIKWNFKPVEDLPTIGGKPNIGKAHAVFHKKWIVFVNSYQGRTFSNEVDSKPIAQASIKMMNKLCVMGAEDCEREFRHLKAYFREVRINSVSHEVEYIEIQGSGADIFPPKDEWRGFYGPSNLAGNS